MYERQISAVFLLKKKKHAFFLSEIAIVYTRHKITLECQHLKRSQDDQSDHLQPLNVVLGFFGNQIDPFKDIGDIIDPPFLDIQHLSGPVQIHHTISRLAKELQESFCCQIQRCLVSRPLPWGSHACTKGEIGN